MSSKLKYLKYTLPILLIILLIIFVKIKDRPNCTIGKPTLNNSQVNGSTVNLSWKNSQHSNNTYLNVSTSKNLNPDGSLENLDVVNDLVTDKDSYSKSNLKPGTYNWNIVSDGCKQRKISDLGTFIIPENNNDNCKLTPATLDTPTIKNSKVNLSWTSSQNLEASYINISTSNSTNSDGILKKLDISNDLVTGKNSYTRENLSAGTYYWNIISDGCGQREMSSLGSFTIQLE